MILRYAYTGVVTDAGGRPDHPSKSFDFRSKERKRILRETAAWRILSPFLDFLQVWPRLNYRKPCFDCHRRIPISRRVAHVAGTSYGVSRILYEFLSWSDSFICLSSISPTPPPLSLSLSLSPSGSPATFRLSPFSPRSLWLLLFSLDQPSYPEGVFYASRTPGLAGRQSQLRSWFKVGARTKYGSVSSYKYFCFFLRDSLPVLLVAPRIHWKSSIGFEMQFRMAILFSIYLR